MRSTRQYLGVTHSADAFIEHWNDESRGRVASSVDSSIGADGTTGAGFVWHEVRTPDGYALARLSITEALTIGTDLIRLAETALIEQERRQ